MTIGSSLRWHTGSGLWMSSSSDRLHRRKRRPRQNHAVLLADPARSQGARDYHLVMQVATGTVVEGKVILEGVSLPEGTVVTVFAKDSEARVRLSPALQAELEEALEDADREEGISGDALLEKLQKYG